MLCSKFCVPCQQRESEAKMLIFPTTFMNLMLILNSNFKFLKRLIKSYGQNLTK